MLKRRKVTIITCTKVTVTKAAGKKTSYSSRALKSRGSRRKMNSRHHLNSSAIQACMTFGQNDNDGEQYCRTGTLVQINDQPMQVGAEGSETTEGDREKRHQNEARGAVKKEGKAKYSGQTCLGEEVSKLKRNKGRSSLPPLAPAGNNTILVEVHSVRKDCIPVPFKGRASDVWDQYHVKMPYSEHNSYEKRKAMGFYATDVSRWEIIKKALMKEKFKDSKEIEETIKKYNKKYETIWKFSALHAYFRELTTSERNDLLCSTLPYMAGLARQLLKLCPMPIPLLRQGREHTLTMSQEQIACLLANAFFCTFPRRNATQAKSEYSNYPDINFSRLFEENTPRKFQKLKTIFWYFTSISNHMPTGLVTFERRSFKGQRNWRGSAEKFTKLHVTCKGAIEKDGGGMLQVDFASAMVGGGVLGSGLVQEEIRFLINTELIIARLFTEKLEDTECLIITGTQQYSNYSGYSDSYTWTEPYVDETPRDAWQRRCTEIVAIDALVIRNHRDQFREQSLDRELSKAYCGFRCRDNQVRTAVATGNWGCGAFKGDAKFKALIQIMAAAEAQRDVIYFTFGDEQLMKNLWDMHQFLQKQNITVGQLYALMEKYCERIRNPAKSVPDCYDYIYHYGSKL